MIEVLRYMHSKGLAYRDLKPENMMIDSEGYIRVIDMGFAKPIPYRSGEKVHDRSFSLCGTPEYVSPELVFGKGHDQAVDYWAFGVFVYELMTGKTPFVDNDTSQVFKMICNSKKYLKFPGPLDQTTRELVEALLEPVPALRLGMLSGRTADVMEHEWFVFDDEFSFDELRSKSFEAPFVPPISGPNDVSNFDDFGSVSGSKVRPYKDKGKGDFAEF